MSVYQHFKKEESTFIDKILEYKMRVEDTYVPILTHFLTPREQFIANSLFSKGDTVNIFFFGGYTDAERKRALLTIASDYTVEDFELTLLDIRYPKKFATISHSQILGSVLGSGIKREKVGDIITDNANWQIFVSNQMSSYIKKEVRKIGNVSISFDNVLLAGMLQSKQQYKVIEETVSSLRIDTLIAKIFHVSREKAKEILDNGYVHINFVVETRTTVELSEQDILSVRKYGRLKLHQIKGLTKNGKYKVVVYVY